MSHWGAKRHWPHAEQSDESSLLVALNCADWHRVVVTVVNETNENVDESKVGVGLKNERVQPGRGYVENDLSVNLADQGLGKFSFLCQKISSGNADR